MNPLLPPAGYSAPLPPPAGYDAQPPGRGGRGRGAPGYLGRGGGGGHARPLCQQQQQQQPEEEHRRHADLVGQAVLRAERQVAAAATSPDIGDLVRQAVAAALAERERGGYQPRGRGRGGVDGGGYGARGSRGGRRGGHHVWPRPTDFRSPCHSARGAGGSDGAPVMSFDLDTPEKIERWRAERRKNYPTDANILRKKQEAAGVPLPSGQKRGSAGDKIGGAGSGKRSRVGAAEKEEEASEVSTAVVGLVADYGSNSDTDAEGADAKLQQEAEGRAAKKGGRGGEDVDKDEEDEVDDDAGEPDIEPVSVSRAGGSDAKDDGGAEDAADGRPQRDRRNRLPCKYFAQGRCTNGDRCGFLHDPALRKPKRRNGPSKPPRYFKRRPNLFSRLIAREVHAENSAILQCLRFIVRNNFLDGPTSVWEVTSGSNQGFLDEVADDNDDDDDDDDEDEQGSAQSD